ncbi:non-structural maintenance of chromosomes element 1 homolog isoform X2 [Rhea pennata]|uniref:non-structural maintenance of chromosomes element 1 homolog isoform X2 n=1 Tax=Rhea pennata TaxID=8795 RepID=UPI002E26F781
MAAQMTDSHRRFLQILMSHGIMEGSEARKLHRHCCEIHKVYYAHDKLDDFINTINVHLQPLFMQIRKGMSEDDGRVRYALVNLAETEITKMASDYTENELELFRKTMDLIILSENGFASSTEILNFADQLKTKKMKKKEAEQVLKLFVEDKWLSEKNGEYTLHTRCIMEMEQYILSNYQGVARKCNICHSLAIQPNRLEVNRYPYSGSTVRASYLDLWTLQIVIFHVIHIHLWSWDFSSGIACILDFKMNMCVDVAH